MTHQYYYKQDKCKSESPRSQDCICWHDEGTGPFFDERFDQKHLRTCNLEWRVKPDELADWKRWCEERQQKLDEMAKAFSQQQARIQRMEEALAWYETKVSDCNRQGPEGDAARDALAKDYGSKAKEAKL